MLARRRTCYAERVADGPAARPPIRASKAETPSFAKVFNGPVVYVVIHMTEGGARP